MIPSITTTFLELGDATSRNLEFSHRNDVWVSYGEETITESNLLEITRYHPEHVFIRTFPKHLEAITGADWEWHLIGRKRTAKMRVQAKRIQCNDFLRIKHKVASSGIQQRQLLIDGANADNMKPVYCIYSTNRQRRIWKQVSRWGMSEFYQAGCLLADASDVPLTTRKLEQIENKCIPWHYLFNRVALVHAKIELLEQEDRELQSYYSVSRTPVPILYSDDQMGQPYNMGWNAPTIADLNEDTERDFDRTGIRKTTDEDQARLRPKSAMGREVALDDQNRLRKRGIKRMMVIDVQEE